MEVSQAIWLMVFLMNALLISPKRFDEIILDFYQDAGIWIVIASCVAEYLLLLTYIGVAAYDFFKNRKMMKKMNVQRRTYEFLKFDESHRDVGNRWREPDVRPRASSKLQVAGLPKKGAKATELGKRSHSRVDENESEPSWQMVKKYESNNAPNNPQLLKFDGESSPAQDNEAGFQIGKLRARRMNKSLKRKQIE